MAEPLKGGAVLVAELLAAVHARVRRAGRGSVGVQRREVVCAALLWGAARCGGELEAALRQRVSGS